MRGVGGGDAQVEESIGRGQTDMCHSLGVGGIQGSWARFNQAQIQRTRLGRVHQMEFNS